MPATWDLRPVRHVWDIFTPTAAQRQQSAHLAWMLANCPTCSTISVRAMVRMSR